MLGLCWCFSDDLSMFSMAAVMTKGSCVPIKARVVSFLVKVLRNVFKTFWAARRCAEWPLNPQSFRTAERSAEANRRAPRYVIGVELSLVESLTPFHNAFSSSTIGVKNVFSYLGSLLISGTMPATRMFSHLNGSSIGNINHSSLFVENDLSLQKHRVRCLIFNHPLLLNVCRLDSYRKSS